MPVREAIGGDRHFLAYDALGGEATAVHARRDVLDHRDGSDFLAGTAARVVHASSGSKSTIASGGSVTTRECARPCAGSSVAIERPILPTPLPP